MASKPSRAILEFLVTPEAGHGFANRGQVSDLAWTCTDLDWSSGDGPAVEGPAEAVILALVGRTVACDELTGAGVDVLRARGAANVRPGASQEVVMDDRQQISYLALETATPVLSATGAEFGTVEHVLQVPELDLFDGIVVKTKHGLRFVDRDQITDITTTCVRCSLSDEDAASLPAPSGPPVLHLDVAYDEGSSLSARFGRLFRRPHWKELE
ncbi:MAG: hypothetical protein ACLQPH_12185 [Acidimicrobiales bacterium]